jgi:hypothetical protein
VVKGSGVVNKATSRVMSTCGHTHACHSNMIYDFTHAAPSVTYDSTVFIRISGHILQVFSSSVIDKHFQYEDERYSYKGLTF